MFSCYYLLLLWGLSGDAFDLIFPQILLDRSFTIESNSNNMLSHCELLTTVHGEYQSFLLIHCFR